MFKRKTKEQKERKILAKNWKKKQEGKLVPSCIEDLILFKGLKRIDKKRSKLNKKLKELDKEEKSLRAKYDWRQCKGSSYAEWYFQYDPETAKTYKTIIEDEKKWRERIGLC